MTTAAALPLAPRGAALRMPALGLAVPRAFAPPRVVPLLLALLLALAAALPGAVARAQGVVVPAGTTTTEDVIVVNTPVDVYGTVEGDVIAFFDDVTIRPGARVAGDVYSLTGHVRNLGGTVTGEVRDGILRQGRTLAATPVRPRTVAESLRATVGWWAIVLVIGFGVLAMASRNLDGVAESLDQGIGTALLIGAAAELLFLPVLLALTLALLITVVGVLAVPLAVVAYVAAAAGLATLGFLAVAFVTGRALVGGEGARRLRASAARTDAVRAVAVGVGIFAALWIATALLRNAGAVALVVHTVAASLTWVATTAGLGAAIRSWAGTRGPRRGPDAAVAVGAQPTDRNGVPVWQTPTPIAGVAAARRTPAPPARTP